MHQTYLLRPDNRFGITLHFALTARYPASDRCFCSFIVAGSGCCCRSGSNRM